MKKPEIINKLREALARDRFEHSLRVEKTAVALAKRHKVSIQKASLAALLHDYARKFSRSGMLKEARRFKMKIDPISRFEPKLLHAELSARLAKKDFGVRSRDILDAIRRHTIGAPGMSKIEKIIYLADHIEEGRNLPGVNKSRRLAFKDLDRAVVETSTQMLSFLLKKGLPFHPGTVETRNHYLLKT
ncbi:MAG: bis(5'-nucleosyl)-tetraphosphatase (symmetrical) YqeK [Candidatus Margulisiibacteriota bacterium]|nr:bis(5'-nucleosyl)-tetraphosphatase (symmetrical) YqeK [Candidatus Margulisiibacteriota bacterium]